MLLSVEICGTIHLGYTGNLICVALLLFGENPRNCYSAPQMARCVVSYRDSEGLRQSVEVDAGPMCALPSTHRAESLN